MAESSTNTPVKEGKGKEQRGFLQLTRAKVSCKLNSEGKNQVNSIQHIRKLNERDEERHTEKKKPGERFRNKREKRLKGKQIQ